MAIDQDAGLEVGMMFALVTMGWAGVCGPDPRWVWDSGDYCIFVAGTPTDNGGANVSETVPPDGWAEKDPRTNGGKYTNAVSAISGQAVLRGGGEHSWFDSDAALHEATPHLGQPETLRTPFADIYTKAAAAVSSDDDYNGVWVELRTDDPSAWLVYFAVLKYEVSTIDVVFNSGQAVTLLQVGVRVHKNQRGAFEDCLGKVISGDIHPECTSLSGKMFLPTRVTYREGNLIKSATGGGAWASGLAEAIIDPCSMGSKRQTRTARRPWTNAPGVRMLPNDQRKCLWFGIDALTDLYLWGKSSFFSYFPTN